MLSLPRLENLPVVEAIRQLEREQARMAEVQRTHGLKIEDLEAKVNLLGQAMTILLEHYFEGKPVPSTLFHLCQVAQEQVNAAMEAREEQLTALKRKRRGSAVEGGLFGGVAGAPAAAASVAAGAPAAGDRVVVSP